MKRNSFLGGVTEELISYDWPIAGLGTQQIGFGICESTGLVMQTSVVAEEKMLDWYSQTATYVNPNHDGKPMPSKVQDLDRLLQTVRLTTNGHPDSVIQFGSSDGYTLSRFSDAGSSRVLGVEPGQKAREYALKAYGVLCQSGTVDDYQVDDRFELIILTHILEHLYNPLDFLLRVQKNITDGGVLLIEVPLWERLDKQGSGVLTFEHVNYFSEDALFSMLRGAGFEPIFSSKLFESGLYPVITVVAKASGVQYETRNSYRDSRALLEAYLKREKKFWRRVEKKILIKLNQHSGSYIYGAGIHTSQMLGNTSLQEHIELHGVIDSSPSKWGKEIAGVTIQPPTILDDLPSDANIIISSSASESYIFDAISKRRSDLTLITLHQ